MIICLGPTPAAQRVMMFSHLRLDAVNRAKATLDGVAGKGVNVAKVLKVLGEEPLAMGFLGGDRGDFIRETLREMGVEMDFVPVEARTRECITVIDEAAASHTELVEESRSVPEAAHTDLLNRLRGRIPKARAIVCSGTIPPGGPGDLYAECARLASASGKLAVVDAQGPALMKAIEARPAVVKHNYSELQSTVGRKLDGETEARSAVRQIHELGASSVVVTAGKLPTLAFDGKRFWRIHAPIIRAVNPIGSGDAFTAGLVWRMLRGDELGEACRWAAAAGTANALTAMAGEVHRQDVERLAPEVRVESIP